MRDFIIESNRIEGITRDPHKDEIEAHRVFLTLGAVTVWDLERFVDIVAGQSLRRYEGQDVFVGGHRPPSGGPGIEIALAHLLDFINRGDVGPFQAHREYETLHPFMDGNGRSGRVLWAWHMQQDGLDPFALPFLQFWYYNSLDDERPRT